MIHPHQQEELDQRFGSRLWDATPGVCCAAFQLGACAHTEAFDPADLTAEDLAEAAASDPDPRPLDDCPF